LLIKGAGSNPTTGSHIEFTPDSNTRYDTVSEGDWDEDAMVWDGDGDGPKLGGVC